MAIPQKITTQILAILNSVAVIASSAYSPPSAPTDAKWNPHAIAPINKQTLLII